MNSKFTNLAKVCGVSALTWPSTSASDFLSSHWRGFFGPRSIKTKTIAFVLLALFANIANSQDSRVWHSLDGKHTIEAAFIKLDGGKITLRQPKTGRDAVISLSLFSKVDRQWIIDFKKAAAQRSTTESKTNSALTKKAIARKAARQGRMYAKILAQRAAIARAQALLRTVFVTRTGDRYHESGCQHLRNGARGLSVGRAQREGYSRCASCK